ncbi:MAG: ribonuclease M5 [Anaerorhabdus sp.]
MKIKEVIIVEGKHDTATLKRYFECETIETGGTCLSDKTIKLIQIAKEKRGVIIFTDPDFPGEKIRTSINQRVDGCKNAFIEKAKAKTAKKVGIEHASKEELEKALSSCLTYQANLSQQLKVQDLVELGLSGHPESKQKREKLAKKFHFGSCNAKTFCQRCNMLQITKKDLEEGLSI